MTHRGPFQPLPFCDSVISKAGVFMKAAMTRKLIVYCLAIRYLKEHTRVRDVLQAKPGTQSGVSGNAG